MRVTLQHIADHCDVSVQTVSSILNNKGHLYREQTRQKVIDTAQRLGYRPNVLARGLRGGRTQTLGLVVPGLNSSAVSNAKLQSIERAAQQHGYRLLIGSYESDSRRVEDHVRDFLGLSVDGLIYWAAADGELQIIDRARDAQTPMVIIEPAEPVDVASVNVDRALGGFLQVQHLHAMGRRRVACLFTTYANYRTKEKLRGIRAASREYGLELDPDLTLTRSSTEGSPPETGVMLVRELLSAGRSFDALLTLSDGVALGAVTELIRQGLRVPQDVAVIGFDDDLFANYCTVPLTSIHQPRNIGDDVMELLVAQIEREPGADYQPHPARLLKPHLVVRASTSA
jgi:LacI family transcriptional regulator